MWKVGVYVSFWSIHMSCFKYLRKNNPGTDLEVSKTVALQLFVLGNVDGRLVAI